MSNPVAIAHTNVAGALNTAAQAAVDARVGAIAEAVFNVKNPAYGAKGNGVTDDTDAIQAAIDAAYAAGGGIVFFPVGRYRVRILNGVRALTIYAGVVLRGAGRDLSTIKLADNQGNYVELIGPATVDADLSGCALEDIAIDQNTAGNPIAAASDLTSGGKGRRAYAVFAGQRIAVRRCRFTDIDSINTVVVNGADVADVEITDNLFDAIGGTVAHDLSVVYVHGAGMTIRGNRLRARSIGLASAVTAIETHGSGQSVAGNYAWGFQAGAIITGVSVASDGVVVTGNTFERVLTGVYLWSYFYGGNVSEPALRDVLVANNTATLDRDAWPLLAAGGGVVLNAPSNAPTRNVRIANNTIRLLSHASAGSATDSVGCGIIWWRTDATVVDDQLTITDNTIDGAIAAGIRCSSTFQRLTIERNTIRNPGLGLGAFNGSYRVGVLVGGTLADSVVRNNLIVDDQTVETITGGVSVLPTSATGCVVADNDVRVASGAAVPEFVPSSGAGRAVFLRQRVASYVAPFYPTIAGSTIEDMATGNMYVQTATPSGTTWAKQFRGGPLAIGSGATITKHLSATVSWNPASVADGATASTVVTVTGAAPGNTVAVGFNVAVPAGALLVGAVTAPDTVTVTLLNKTGAALDLGTGTLRADVWQH